MAAFDRIECGCPGVDEILDSIRLGDNVVWQISDLDEFRAFAEPFARQAVSDGRNVIYIRFAQHDPILKDLSGIKVKEFDPDLGFEAFTVAIHNEITEQGRDAFYVFDCLSELQSVWYTDLMMGNFFRVTCPYLFELDTVAYFPLLRGRHSFDAVARIRDTTQLLLDICSNDEYVYLHPLKVWNRYSDKMFMPYAIEKADGTGGLAFSAGSCAAVEDGVGMSRFYQTLHEQELGGQDQNFDSYDRFFNNAKLEYAKGIFAPDTEEQIIRSTMTKDKRLSALVKKYFKPEDYFTLRDRMIGSGAIGGKACGMLLARKIAEAEVPEFQAHSEPHDSFYVGSDVYYTYIVSNGDWDLRIEQRTPEGYFGVSEALKERLLCGAFPSKIRDQFLQVLQYFGQSPFIVRSSSFLEDGFGNAFAGKYESVFCVNQGSLEERLEAFEQAVRTVYASTMSPVALEYRRRYGLDKKDEQMAVLVQRVSGSYYGKYFMPGAAGVGYSHSAYRWQADMDPSAGMLRLVMGLGTKAVDRTQEDYPRLANLDRPTVTVYTTSAEKHKFSQRHIDTLDRETNRFREISLDDILPLMPAWYKKMVLENDTEAEQHLREMGRQRQVWFISCQGLLQKKEFTDLMQKMLKALEGIYKSPVDIEYTVNMDEKGDFVVNLLQCRPLYVGGSGERIDLSAVKCEDVFFEIKNSSMGSSGKRKIDIVILIDPVKYYNLPYNKKYDVAAAIHSINLYYRETDKNVMLMTPGRIGTSSPELGVPVTFREISGFSAVCEVADERAGYRPELSYGSHMFQDLVEAEIFYGAIYNNDKTITYAPEIFRRTPNLFTFVCSDYPELQNIIRVYAAKNFYCWMDAASNHAICGIEYQN